MNRMDALHMVDVVIHVLRSSGRYKGRSQASLRDRFSNQRSHKVGFVGRWDVIDLDGTRVDLSTLDRLFTELSAAGFCPSTLSMTENVLETLPDSIGGLTGLVELDLSWNRLMCLPNSIGDLVNLKHLTILGNRGLVNLPDTMANIPHLSIRRSPPLQRDVKRQER